MIFQKILPGSGAVEGADDMHKSGFAATRGTHDGDEFSSANFEGNVFKSVNGNFTGVVSFGDVAEVNESRCGWHGW